MHTFLFQTDSIFDLRPVSFEMVEKQRNLCRFPILDNAIFQPSKMKLVQARDYGGFETNIFFRNNRNEELSPLNQSFTSSRAPENDYAPEPK